MVCPRHGRQLIRCGGGGGGVLSQLQKEGEVVIAYASHRRLSQRRYCTTRREMLAAVVMCTHFRSYLRGEQFTLRTDHSSLRWLQRFRNGDGVLGLLEFAIGAIFSHIRISSGVTTCKRGTACLANVVSANVQTVRCRQRIRRCREITKKLKWWISPSQRRR